MITASEIYWILKLDAIRDVFFMFSIFTGIFGLAMVISWGINSVSDCDWIDKKAKELAAACKKQFFITVPILALLVIATAMIPSTKQMAAIKVIPAIANSEIVGELSADVKELYRMGINAIKEQLTGNNKESEK